MDALDCIKGRRSIRKFTAEKVSREDIEKLIDLARFSPTWKNSQSVRYIAVCDDALKAKIADEAVMGFEGNKNIINGAPVLIVEMTVDKRAGYERDGSFSTSKETHWQSFDAGICAQTLSLAAYEAGLGAVIMGIYAENEVKEILDTPEGQSVSALIAIGHPDQAPDAPKRKEVADLLTFK